MRKKITSAFVLTLLTVMAGSAQAGMAPLSPEFLKWREEQKNTVNAAGETALERNYGVRPSPVSLSHLANNPVQLADETESLSVSFDLRSWGVVPPIRHQAYWGTCWSFAVMSAVETNYLMQINGLATDKYITSSLASVGTSSADVDLSEMHLAWFAFMGSKLEQRFTNTRAKSLEDTTKGSTVLNVGGYPDVPVAVMARGKGWGPVTEKELPWTNSETDIIVK